MRMAGDTLAIILGGGQGSRLFPLTATRSKPAVPIGGKYRLIDVPVSSCLHADIRRIYVLTQFNSASLNRHVSLTYRLDMFMQGDDPSGQPRDGLGIGLTLARRLIELHDGRIQAMSEGAGTGATFVIRLPRSNQ